MEGTFGVADAEMNQRDIESLRTTLHELNQTLKALPRDIAATYVRADVLEPRLRNIEDDVKQHGDWLTWAQRIVIGAVIVALLGLLFYIGGTK